MCEVQDGCQGVKTTAAVRLASGTDLCSHLISWLEGTKSTSITEHNCQFTCLYRRVLPGNFISMVGAGAYLILAPCCMFALLCNGPAAAVVQHLKHHSAFHCLPCPPCHTWKSMAHASGSPVVDFVKKRLLVLESPCTSVRSGALLMVVFIQSTLHG